MSALVAGGAVLLAVLVLTGAGRPPLVRARGGPGARRVARPIAVLVVAVATVVVLASTDGRLPVSAVLGVLVLSAAAVGGALVGRAGRRRARAAATSGRVLAACDLLAAELQAGVPPGRALVRAAADWPVLAPVARAEELGADVPTALRAAADEPGAGDLRRVAAAWEVSHRTGQGLAPALARTAAGLRTAGATRRTVAAELASARATARLLALLPLGVLVLGSGAGGGAAWRFLLTTPAGVGCLAAGAALGLLGLAWIERLAGSVEAGSL